MPPSIEVTCLTLSVLVTHITEGLFRTFYLKMNFPVVKERENTLSRFMCLTCLPRKLALLTQSLRDASGIELTQLQEVVTLDSEALLILPAPNGAYSKLL